MRRLPGVPLEREQGVLGDVVGDLDLLGNGVTTCDSGLAGSKGRTVDTLASSARVRLEGIAGEPVGPLASGVLAVWVDAAVLTRDVGAVECAGFEACFGGLLLGLSWDVARCQEFVDELLVLADAVGEHASVVAVVVDAPFAATCQDTWPLSAFNWSLTRRRFDQGCKLLLGWFPKRCQECCNQC